jgi:hypothetical protein
MARGKSKDLKQFQKVLTVLVSGNPVTVDEIEATLGGEIYMYRLSTEIWCIKNYAGGIVKSIKDGRKVVAYQLMNVDEVKEYMKRAGINTATFTPNASKKKPSVCKLAKLADLGAQPVAPIVEETAVVEEVAEVKNVNEDDLVVEEITDQQ